MHHTKIDAYRSRNKVSIGISTRATIDWTSIHTSSTTDTVQYFHMIGLCQDIATAIVHDNDMILTVVSFLLTWPAEVRSVGSSRLSRTTTSQQASKYTQCLHVGHNLFDAKCRDIQLRMRHTHIGITFIGTNYYITRTGHSKVASCHGCISIQKVLTQVATSSMGKVSGVAIARLCTHLLFETLAYLLLFHMQGWHHHMTGGQVHQLQDTLAKIGLYGIYATLYQIWV